jgi:calcineurin-like phosphoesterase family protein
MKNIWFTSDTHFGHKNIVRGVSEWSPDKRGGCRNFDTVDDMNFVLINSINAVVKHDDILYHLGDWSFGGHENIQKFRNQINCREIHLIFGNHDEHIEPTDSTYRGCFSSTQYVKQFSLPIDSKKSGKYGKQLFFLSHYSHQVWNKSHKGAIHLFGHSHGTIEGIGKSMDVGVDTNDFYPYHLDEILDRMKGTDIAVLDHHDGKTT